MGKVQGCGFHSCAPFGSVRKNLQKSLFSPQKERLHGFVLTKTTSCLVLKQQKAKEL